MNNNEPQPMTQDEFVAALFEATTYYGKTIIQVKTVPAKPGFVGKVYVTVEDLTTRDGVRTTSTTFSTKGPTYIGPNALA